MSCKTWYYRFVYAQYDDYRFVVNYDFPMHIEDYVHRVGRTGRAGYVEKDCLLLLLADQQENHWRLCLEVIGNGQDN